MNEFGISRKNSQPLEYPNAGSTFKRKEGIITAKLIDECGLKGFNIGDAEVSTKHAGFIINKGNATSKDIKDLIEIDVKVKTATIVSIILLVSTLIGGIPAALIILKKKRLLFFKKK